MKFFVRRNFFKKNKFIFKENFSSKIAIRELEIPEKICRLFIVKKCASEYAATINFFYAQNNLHEFANLDFFADEKIFWKLMNSLNKFEKYIQNFWQIDLEYFKKLDPKILHKSPKKLKELEMKIKNLEKNFLKLIIFLRKKEIISKNGIFAEKKFLENQQNLKKFILILENIWEYILNERQNIEKVIGKI